mmetsp:Transcript_12773/g.51346  ORF Transcript_12773/g.51346 Transcript_12773/m.51346 type:complete len:351 (+) Transcript_12773:378-1430(+)
MVRVAVGHAPRRHLPALAAPHRPRARGVRLAANEQVHPRAAAVARFSAVVHAPTLRVDSVAASALRALLGLRRLLSSLALLPTRVSRPVGSPALLLRVGGATSVISSQTRIVVVVVVVAALRGARRARGGEIRPSRSTTRAPRRARAALPRRRGRRVEVGERRERPDDAEPARAPRAARPRQSEEGPRQGLSAPARPAEHAAAPDDPGSEPNHEISRHTRRGADAGAGADQHVRPRRPEAAPPRAQARPRRRCRARHRPAAAVHPSELATKRVHAGDIGEGTRRRGAHRARRADDRGGAPGGHRARDGSPQVRPRRLAHGGQLTHARCRDCAARAFVRRRQLPRRADAVG